MKKTKNNTIVNYLLLLVAGLLGWLAVNYLLWRVFGQFEIFSNFWAMLEALSTAVTAAAILSAGLVANEEIKEANRTRHLSVMENLFQELNSEEHINARKWIYKKLPSTSEELDRLRSKDRHKMKLVLNSIDKLAFLTQSDLIPVELIMPWVNPMVVKSWEKLGPVVRAVRAERKEPDYYIDAENFAEICIEWRKKLYPQEQSEWVEKKEGY